jgi:hypothetical protein
MPYIPSIPSVSVSPGFDGDFVLIAKDNQATLADDLRLFFSEPPHDCRDWRTARTENYGHGRLEIRELVASTELNEFLGGQWAGVAQGAPSLRMARYVGRSCMASPASHRLARVPPAS